MFSHFESSFLCWNVTMCYDLDSEAGSAPKVWRKSKLFLSNISLCMVYVSAVKLRCNKFICIHIKYPFLNILCLVTSANIVHVCALFPRTGYVHQFAVYGLFILAGSGFFGIPISIKKLSCNWQGLTWLPSWKICSTSRIVYVMWLLPYS